MRISNSMISPWLVHSPVSPTLPRCRFSLLVLISCASWGFLSASGCNKKSGAVDTNASSSGQDSIAPDTLLLSAVELLQSPSRSQASYEIAADRLNKYLENSRGSGNSPIAPLSEEMRGFLTRAVPARRMPLIDREQFLFSDALHLENCFLYRDIAHHVTAALRNDWAKTEALFDWVVRNVQLPSADDPARLPVSPRVVFLTGRGSEQERAWTFMELLRQVDIDSVMLGYPELVSDSKTKRTVTWIPGVLLDESLYLFDTTLGLPIPGPGGKGVATLRQAMEDPTLLTALDLDHDRPYPVQAEQLKEVVVLLESSPSFWAPRMRFLQERLSGKNRAVLWSDLPGLQKRAKQAVGQETGVELWALPFGVDENSRGDKEYKNQIEQMLMPILPYLEARLAHLRGAFGDAIRVYMRNRTAPPAKIDAAPQMRQYYERMREDSTYFLGQVKFEQEEYGPAIEWGRRYLQRYPSGDWVVSVNYLLGRCAEAQEDSAKAIEYFTVPNPGPQGLGNLLRARRFGWKPESPAP
ncbi:MAG: hypothetical protein HY000_11770, partial [Planctomycetes bacterium]|nr:hypothetical protein [Planctomycetota bacterium]